MVKALGICGLGIAIGASQSAHAGVDDFRAKIGKWVETRRILSEEVSDWEVEKETLRATQKLLKQQQESLESAIAELESSSTRADMEREQLLAERDDHQRASRQLENEVRSMEKSVLALAPMLPEPLRRKLDLLLVQIPEDPEQLKPALGQRLMSVLGVLAQAEKFNGTATFVGETRAVAGDQKVQVRTLYWGLGQAIYIDAQGRTSGIGRPGARGWEFAEDAELANAAGLLLDIYEGNVDTIEFVPIPVATN